MVVIEHEDFGKALEISKEVGHSFNYKSFSFEEKICYEIFSSSGVLKALILKEFKDKSEITKLFMNL